MERKIKVKESVRDIKLLDRPALVAQHMKSSSVRTKEAAIQTEEPKQSSPVEYAEDSIGAFAAGMGRESIYWMGSRGTQVRRRDRGKMGAPEGRESTGNIVPFGNEPLTGNIQDFPQEGTARIKMARPVERTIKDSASKGKYTIKNTMKGTVKSSGRNIKTAEQTARTTVKTTGQAVVQEQRVAREMIKNYERTLRASRQVIRNTALAARATARNTKAAVKASIATVKSLVKMIIAGGETTVLVLIIVVIFGGVLCAVGGENANAVSPVSAEVEAYEPVLRKYAIQYGIPEYVELLKAVMMQESGGRGLDPMQSSEGGFNTRYPRKPNGITDPEYSIQCGVQELKNCLVKAEVKSPVDLEHIKLALQGYNFGNGYIIWAQQKYGGYSVANAAEFSNMMAQRMGWSSYGDIQYVSHVLRYYPFGRIPTGVGDQAIVQVALSQEGNVNGEPYWSWYGFDQRVSWCACFVSWCADQCGYIENGMVPKFARCSDGVEWFRSRGQFRDGSYVPTAGDIIFFDWGNNGSIDHVGIVESVSNSVVHTIEGNSSNAVKRREYVAGSRSIYGYGVLYN